jgi:hypothetical protein
MAQLVEKSPNRKYSERRIAGVRDVNITLLKMKELIFGKRPPIFSNHFLTISCSVNVSLKHEMCLFWAVTN